MRGSESRNPNRARPLSVPRSHSARLGKRVSPLSCGHQLQGRKRTGSGDRCTSLLFRSYLCQPDVAVRHRETCHRAGAADSGCLRLVAIKCEGRAGEMGGWNRDLRRCRRTKPSLILQIMNRKMTSKSATKGTRALADGYKLLTCKDLLWRRGWDSSRIATREARCVMP